MWVFSVLEFTLKEKLHGKNHCKYFRPEGVLLYPKSTPSGLKYSQHFRNITFLPGQISKLEKTTQAISV